MYGRNKARTFGVHAFLILYSLVVLIPILIMVLSSLKTNREIISDPLGFPKTFYVEGFSVVWLKSNFPGYFANSIIVTLAALLLTLFVSALASYVFAKHRFRGGALLFFYLLIGIMIPIRLGVLNIFNLIKSLGLYDHLLGLVFVYTAMSIPFSVLILTEFMRNVPDELSESARIDGCSEFRIFHGIILPLVRPAIATAAVYHFIPIWNDLYFPLILIKSEANHTVILGITRFFGQYQTDWNLAFSALTLVSIPSFLFYYFLSKQLVSGLTAGAVKA